MLFAKKFIQDESGATAIEYGLIAALVSIAAIVAMGAMGNELGEMFNTVASDLDNAQNAKFVADFRAKYDGAYPSFYAAQSYDTIFFIKDAIEYEIDRQISVLESGGTVDQETRGYDPDRGEPGGSQRVGVLVRPVPLGGTPARCSGRRVPERAQLHRAQRS